MSDFRKMTVESLRKLARRTLGAGHARLRTKAELVRALERAGGPRAEAAGAPGKAARPAGSRAGAAPGKAVRVAKGAGREGARGGARSAKARKAAPAGKAAPARKPAGAVTGGVAEAAKHARAAPEGLPDMEGYFVARVRGEGAAREAPHPMAEGGSDSPYPVWAEGVGRPLFEERLGELPWSYGDDAFVALPRDPRTAFLYWDHSRETLERSFGGLEEPRAQLWIFGRTDAGWDRLRAIEFALESRGYYVHDLEPGRTYRAEIHAVDRQGRDRLVGRGSNEVTLPRVGASPVIDDRFILIPWDMPLGRLLGPGHPGSPFSEEARALLERLSDWTRFSGGAWGSAGGMGGRPSSPTSSPSGPPGSGEQR